MATEKELRELGDGCLAPLTGSYETEAKEKISYWYKWYKLVDEHVDARMGDMSLYLQYTNSSRVTSYRLLLDVMILQPRVTGLALPS